MDIVGKVSNPCVAFCGSALALIYHRSRPPEVVRFLVAVPLAMVAAKITKLVVDKRRPRLFVKRSNQSFPSGHSTGTAALALSLLASNRKWRALPVAAAVIGIVNVSRVRRGKHWPVDVIAGDAFGAAGAIGGAVAAWLTQAGVAARSRRISDRRPEGVDNADAR